MIPKGRIQTMDESKNPHPKSRQQAQNVGVSTSSSRCLPHPTVTQTVDSFLKASNALTGHRFFASSTTTDNKGLFVRTGTIPWQYAHGA
ncbi:hypothetical protein O181_034777 [Austropuccinia psidii MF-1]|uniref:Uncharacterized protein n=1 Tax=Austropuccinia psidii MF-1 TaxID=1389203 RepID=A0A9Q3D7B1_9BASI|nr:hypothetical protein [Austropuccinia psidii MF-1]